MIARTCFAGIVPERAQVFANSARGNSALSWLESWTNYKIPFSFLIWHFKTKLCYKTHIDWHILSSLSLVTMSWYRVKSRWPHRDKGLWFTKCCGTICSQSNCVQLSTCIGIVVPCSACRPFCIDITLRSKMQLLPLPKYILFPQTMLKTTFHLKMDIHLFSWLLDFL